MTAIQSPRTHRSPIAAVVLCAAALAGCAADGSLFETASIAPAAPKTVASVDPQCATLAQQIEQIRNEGTVGRLEKVAAGKSATAVVKRNALQQQAQLNKANADYIAKCGPAATRSAAAAPAPVVTAAATAGASGVTVVPPKTATNAATAAASAQTTVATPAATPKQ